jgi:hypothetical protein
MATSGTYTAGLIRANELAVDCFERCSIRAAEIVPDHMMSMKRSMNFVMQSWSNRGINLWTRQLLTFDLSEGVATYSVPTQVVDVLPNGSFLRQYILQGPTDVVPDFATTALSTTITATQTDHGYVANGWINIIVPVAVGGLVLLGLYQVISVPDSDTYTFAAASAATGTASGGAVPSFHTTAASTTVTVTLAAHGYLAGQSFVVQTATNVGGVTLTGTYAINTVPTADTFTITSLQTAGSTDTQSENGGDTQIAGQSTSTETSYIDRIMSPISRDEYAAQPNKQQQGFPTTYWYNRLINSEITLWQVPDQNGPYVLYLNCSTQIEDIAPTGTQTVQIPARFLEAFCSGVAANFALKWAQDKAPAMLAYAQQMWQEAADEDREKVSTYMIPQLGGYYR